MCRERMWLSFSNLSISTHYYLTYHLKSRQEDKERVKFSPVRDEDFNATTTYLVNNTIICVNFSLHNIILLTIIYRDNSVLVPYIWYS